MLVKLANHTGAIFHRPVIQLAGNLVFNNRAFFLHHQDFLQPPRKLMGGFRLQRPGHGNFIHPQPDGGGLLLVDAQIFECLQNIEIGLAASHNTEARFGAVDHNAIEIIGPRKRPRRVNFVFIKAFFLRQWRVWPASVYAVFWHFKIFWQNNVYPMGINHRRYRRIHILGDGLKAHPAARIARQLPAENTEV